VTVPAEYDAVTMAVEPGALNFAADLIQASVNEIVSALNKIGDTLSNLALGWAGSSAAEAKDFSNQWMNAMTGLFGSKIDPKSGVMNQVNIALLTATGNYSSAESAITKMFDDVTSMIGTAASGPDTAPIPVPAGTLIPDATLSAVAEIDWISVPS
jgi:uncharacterized protein YukE